MSSIPIEEAVASTANWRTFNANNTVCDIPMNQIFPNAYTVNMADISAILSEPGVAKIRIYFGYNTSKPSPLPSGQFAMQVMLVGVTTDGKDIVYATGSSSGIYDHCYPCPTTCDSASPLSASSTT